MKIDTKVLIIGLDGATWTALTPWLENGSLPNLASLRQTGCWGELFSTLPPLSATAWSTFATGKNPGKHSVFHFVRQGGSSKTGKAKPEIADSRSVKSATLWDILGHHQRKVGLINVPMTYPPRPVNGFMITGLLTPPGAEVFTYPPELSNELTDYEIDLNRFIAHKPFARDSDDPPSVEPSLELMQEFHLMMEKRARAALSLMRSNPWDMFMVVFTGTDRMGHYLWPYHRVIDLDGTPESRQLYEAIHDYYVCLDERIGELVAQAGPDTATIIMSDHGMGPIFTKYVNWNYWLHQQGWLFIKSGLKDLTSADSWLVRLGVSRDKVARIARRIPGLSKNRLVRKVKETRAAIDMERTKVHFERIFNNVGGFRINLPEGASNVADTRQSLREELIQAVQQLEDPTTGQPIVQRIYRGEEYYHGPYTHNPFDVLVIMAPQYAGNAHFSHYSSLVTPFLTPSNPGGHYMEGIFMASGPGIASQPEASSGLTIQDIAPTVLYLLGLPIPSDMDGRVLTEIINSDLLASRSVVQGPPLTRWPSDNAAQFVDEELSEEGEQRIEERLRALGYLD